MTDKEVILGALFDLAEDVAKDPKSNVTVLVLGDVEDYSDKVPDSYGSHISGKQIDSFEGVPVMMFEPRYVEVEEDDLVFGDGHLGGSHKSEGLPSEFEHVISSEDYVAAVIYQEESRDGKRSGVESSVIGDKEL